MSRYIIFNRTVNDAIVMFDMDQVSMIPINIFWHGAMSDCTDIRYRNSRVSVGCDLPTIISTLNSMSEGDIYNLSDSPVIPDPEPPQEYITIYWLQYSRNSGATNPTTYDSNGDRRCVGYITSNQTNWTNWEAYVTQNNWGNVEKGYNTIVKNENDKYWLVCGYKINWYQGYYILLDNAIGNACGVYSTENDALNAIYTSGDGILSLYPPTNPSDPDSLYYTYFEIQNGTTHSFLPNQN